MLRDLRYLYGILAPFAVAGITGMVLYVAVVSTASIAVAHFGYSLAVAVAASAVGAFIGFIFGIPKTLSGIEPQVPTPTAGIGKAAEQLPAGVKESPSPVGDNTNLEQISDWLTKLIVGATLTQVGSIGSYVEGIATALAEGFGAPLAKPFFGAVVVFWSIHGFFMAYLLTRRVLPEMWRNARREVQFDEGAVEEIKQYTKGIQHGGERAKAPDVVFAASEIPMEAIAPADLATWGLAQIARERYDLAADALERAFARRPDDLELRENLVYAYLFLDPPRGFEQAIAEGEKVSKKSAALLVYLAAAYGQKYKWSVQGHAPPEELSGLKEKALSSARQALERDPIWKSIVRGMLDPSAEDNDLSAFENDQAFVELVK